MFDLNELDELVDKIYRGGAEGHGPDHARFVMKEAGRICFALTNDKEHSKLAVIAAAFHDFDRGKAGPGLAAKFAEGCLAGKLPEEEIAIVKSAIMAHTFGIEIESGQVVLKPDPERKSSVEIALFLADKLEQIGEKAIGRRNRFLAEVLQVCSMRTCVSYWNERVRRLEKEFTRYYHILEPLYPSVRHDVEIVGGYARALERGELEAVERLMDAFAAKWSLITVSSPTKVILCGEHFVVHGKPAISMPTSIRNLATLTKNEDGAVRILADFLDEKIEFVIGEYASGEASERAANGNGKAGAIEFVAALVRKLRDTLKIREGLAIAVRVKGFKGLGNSASISASLVYAFHLARGYPREYLEGSEFRKKLLQLVHESEEISHGRASGIDATTVAMARPLRFQKGTEPFEIALECPEGYVLAIVDTYIDCRNTTRELVEKFTKNLEQMGDDERMEYLEKYDKALMMFAAGKWKEAFELNQSLLGIVTSDGARKAIEAAKPFGAAKITGAGGEGGAVIALVNDFGKFRETVESMGFKVYRFEIDTAGVQVETIS